MLIWSCGGMHFLIIIISSTCLSDKVITPDWAVSIIKVLAAYLLIMSVYWDKKNVVIAKFC